MSEMLRRLLRLVLGYLFENMPKKEEKHGQGHTDDFILAALLKIEQGIDKTNKILRKTERHNKERHEELLAALKPAKPPGVGLLFKFGVPELKERTDMPAETSITNEQKISVTLKITTEAGKPAEVDEPPTWTKVSGDATITAASDGLSAVVTSSDTPGDSSFLVEADADLGEGVTPISDTFTVHVLGAQAKNLGLAFGTPEPK